MATREPLAALFRSADPDQIRQATEMVRALSVEERKAVLHRLELTGARLDGADLRGLFLDGTILWRANLEGAQLAAARLRGADLRGANLEDADLRGADLTDAVMRGANLRGARMDAVTLHRADLRGAMLVDAALRGADFTGANIENADLRDAHLDRAVWTDAHWGLHTRWSDGPPEVRAPPVATAAELAGMVEALQAERAVLRERLWTSIKAEWRRHHPAPRPGDIRYNIDQYNQGQTGRAQSDEEAALWALFCAHFMGR